MSQLIAGVCYISIDGQRLLLKGSATATASNMTREPVMANGGVAGHKETPVAPTLSGQFVVDRNFPIEKLQNATDMTVVAEFANERSSRSAVLSLPRKFKLAVTIATPQLTLPV